MLHEVRAPHCISAHSKGLASQQFRPKPNKTRHRLVSAHSKGLIGGLWSTNRLLFLAKGSVSESKNLSSQSNLLSEESKKESEEFRKKRSRLRRTGRKTL